MSQEVLIRVQGVNKQFDLGKTVGTTIGLPTSSFATPVARSRARAPTMFRPLVTVRDRSSGMARMVALGGPSSPGT